MEPRLPRRSKHRARRWLRSVACVIAGVLAACSGPFFPVPPPEEMTFSSLTLTDGNGTMRTFWQGTRGPDSLAANARFFVQDVTRRIGVDSYAGADGSYVSPLFEGAAGDQIQIYFTKPGGESSENACLLLQTGAPTRCP